MLRNIFGMKKGSALLQFAIVLPILLAFLLFLLDMGFLYWTRAKAKNCADSVALAAVLELNGTAAGLTRASSVAASIAAEGDPSDEFLFAPGNEIEFGVWTNHTFTPSQQTGANAARVTFRRTAAKGNAVSLFSHAVFFFMGHLFPETADVSMTSIAFIPKGPAVRAAIFPLAASSCGVLKEGKIACDRELVLGAFAPCTINPSDCLQDPNKHFAWTVGTTSTQFGTSDLVAQGNFLVGCLGGDHDSCAQLWVSVSDQIGMKTGNEVAAFSSNKSQFNQDFIDAHGGSVLVQMPVYNLENCLFPPNGAMTRSVVGIATIAIQEIQTHNSDKYIRAQIKCDVDIPYPTGDAEDFGTWGSGPGVLVQ